MKNVLKESSERSKELGYNKLKLIGEQEETLYLEALDSYKNKVELEFDYRGGIWEEGVKLN